MREIQAFKKQRKEVATFTADLCHTLVMWAWSRQPGDVVFDEEVEEYLVEAAIKQAENFHVSIPLIPPAEYPIKLARMAVACAAFFFSTNHTGSSVIVKKEHVDLVCEFINNIYSSNSMKFHIYSKQMLSKEKVGNIDEIKNIVTTPEIRDMLLALDGITPIDIETIFQIDRDEIKTFLYTLQKNNCLLKRGHVFIKTTAFLHVLGTMTEFKGEEKPAF
jgi:hypothetical protein